MDLVGARHGDLGERHRGLTGRRCLQVRPGRRYGGLFRPRYEQHAGAEQDSAAEERDANRRSLRLRAHTPHQHESANAQPPGEGRAGGEPGRAAKIGNPAAEADERRANEQGKGGAMHDRLFNNQQQLQPAALEKHAEALGLDVQGFKTCLDSSKYSDKITASLKEGQKVGVTGTPAFFLGYTQGDGAEVKAVKFLSGALPFTAFKDNIDKLLDTKK